MLTRWNRNAGWAAPWLSDPFEDLGVFTELRRQMNRTIDDFDHAPRLELEDGAEALKVRAELPGFRKEDIDVQLERSVLTIRAKRSVDAPDGYVAHRRERTAMELARAFQLPCKVDPEKTIATLENGVLELTLPKLREEQPRRLEVKVR